jgi:ATP-binding cassette subfamily F protein 3
MSQPITWIAYQGYPKGSPTELRCTLIVVSHDRDFLNGLANKVYEFGNKRVKEYLGNIQYFLETKKLDNLKEIERKN